MRLFAILSIATIALGAYSQSTQKLTATKANEYGLIYSLPTTVIDVTIETEKTVKTPGEFYNYAKKYLNLDPIMEPSVNWTVKNIYVNTRGRADENERYLVQFKNGSTPFMLLTEENFPVSVNDENVTLPEAPDLPESTEAEPTILQLPVAAQAVTEEMLQSRSSAKRAELAANKIYEIRQSRNDIISGQADQMPSDGKAMQLVLDNLSRQEEALTAMFIGTVQTSTSVETITVDPETLEDKWHTIVARISSTDGVVESNNLSGDPIYFDLTITERGSIPVNDKGEPKKFPKGGLAYRIPGKATIEISDIDGTLWSGETELSQTGIVFGLDPGMFTDKKAPAYVIFNPTTGAIRELGTKD